MKINDSVLVMTDVCLTHGLQETLDMPSPPFQLCSTVQHEALSPFALTQFAFRFGKAD